MHKKISKFLELIPSDDQLDFKEKALPLDYQQMLELFRSQYRVGYDEKVIAALDAKYVKGCSLQEYLERKCKAYETSGTQWSWVIRFLRCRDLADPDLQNLLDAWKPVDLNDLLSKAARYDEVEALKKSDRYHSEPVEQHMNDEDNEGRSQLNNDFLDDDLHIDEHDFENNLYSEEDDLQDDELSTLLDLSFNQNENLAFSSKLTCSRSSFSRNFSARTSP